MPINTPQAGPPSQLDRPPSLPPEVQASTFNQLAGQQDPTTGAGPSLGGSQMVTIVGQLAMQMEMMAMKLGQLIPGSENIVAVIQQATKQLALAALTSQGQSQQAQPEQPVSPMDAMMGPPATQGPPSIPMMG